MYARGHARTGFALNIVYITASETAMRYRCLMYVSTQYDDVSCRCSVAKLIVRPSEQLSDVRYLLT